MEKFETTEALLAWIVEFFSTSFGNSAILKGGMALRLMHSPRYTNDVDYIFVPFDSKRDVKDIVEKALSQVNGLRYESSMNSKALRILLTYGGQSAQIEINVEKGCPSIPMSSALLSASHGRPTRILRIMEPSISFAHKIAAWNEREPIRHIPIRKHLARQAANGHSENPPSKSTFLRKRCCRAGPRRPHKQNEGTSEQS